ncbi:sodium/hydrogen exchanger 6 isoform X3 [Contarinia nasturtii]|uniref:sodium/hydrogen exchanger 6 isoform X3 n=1 Tax=Contarinia nasturtii TaxID=265458 RepID=UPI0012D481AB|nr:sodium/hydrogen exchanger 6 isoform X3 [Contarinia nasturtii]
MCTADKRRQNNRCDCVDRNANSSIKMAMSHAKIVRLKSLPILYGVAGIFLFSDIVAKVHCESTDIELDAKATLLHRIDSFNLLVYTFLLTLTILTIWLFKHHRVSWLHETGLAIIYGLFVGALIRYAASKTTTTHISVYPNVSTTTYNQSLPPDSLWFNFPGDLPIKNVQDQTYAYTFRGQMVNREENGIDLKAIFDPEIFFNIILPPIIFYAGYSLKRKYFFRNLGAILTFAILGTTISALLIGSLLYVAIKFLPGSLKFTFLDTLYFGALISPTDPLTILAIFSALHVDVNLYALVFGESVLNDAVAIVMSSSIQKYDKHYSSSGGFEAGAFFHSVGDFCRIFSLSLAIGAVMGCVTALMTKFTRIRDFPLLESALFVLMSYSTFLIAEVTELTGIVSVLFCGICQAHYTYNNLSDDSRLRTKQIFELLNFLAENFIFSYIGVSMFTFPKHHFDFLFITTGFICAMIGRAANIYPLSFLLNLGRKPKIPMNFQHMLFFAGLRGAMSFALAIRNTVSEARQAMLTTTSLIVIFTVITQGGATNFLLKFFQIPFGVEDETEALNHHEGRSVYNSMENTSADIEHGASPDVPANVSTVPKKCEKALLARIWGNFDKNYMKPLLTHSRPTLLETLPVCCNPLARLLTTTEQLTQERTNIRHSDSDSDLCLNDNDDYRSGSISGSTLNNNIGTLDSRVRRSSNGRVSIRLVSDEQSTIMATYKNVDH